MIYRLLSLLVLVASPSLADGEKRVNLVHPAFSRASFVGNVGDTWNITLKTRAANYELVNFDRPSGSKGSLYRTSNWVEPKTVGQKAYWHYDGQKLYSEQENDVNKMLNDIRLKPLMYQNNFRDWVLCQAYFVVDKPSDKACERDNMITWCPKYQKIYPCEKQFFDIHINYSVPMTTGFVRANKGYKGDASTHDFIWFDLTGRMFTFRLTWQEPRTFALKDTRQSVTRDVWDLSTILNPYSEKQHAPWMKPLDLFKDKPALKSKAENGLLETMRMAYIQAISPIYPDEDSGGADKPIALCFSNGYIIDEQKLVTGSPSLSYPNHCRWKGDDQRDFLPSLKKRNPESRIAIYAFHVANSRNNTYMHIVYSVQNNVISPGHHRYSFLSYNGILKSGKKSEEEYVLDTVDEIGPGEKPSGRVALAISLTPNDIIGYKNDRCDKTIALYDMVYTVHEVNESVFGGHEKAQVLKGLNVYINAAFIHRQTLYIFTQANTLLEAPVSMDASCQVMTVKFESMQESLGQDYIYFNAYQKAGEKRLRSVPQIIDYQEIEEGADDTKPKLASREDLPPGPSSTTPTPTKPPKPSPDQKAAGTDIVIVIIAVIIGGLIIAGCVYLFCLRATDAPRIRSHKSRGVVGVGGAKVAASAGAKQAVLLSPPSELHAKTVRSSFPSETGSKALPLLKTPSEAGAASPKTTKSSKEVAAPTASPPKSPTTTKKGSKSSKSPLAQVKSKSPLTKEKSKSPLTRQNSKSPLGKPKSKSPLTILKSKKSSPKV